MLNLCAIKLCNKKSKKFDSYTEEEKEENGYTEHVINITLCHVIICCRL